MNDFNLYNVDSKWKYSLGRGWNKVHVEINEDGCHIQLLKQSFWQRIWDIVLGLFDRKVKPQIEDRVFTYLDSKDEKLKKFDQIRNKVFRLESEGIAPSNIRDYLIRDEEIAQKSYLLGKPWAPIQPKPDYFSPAPAKPQPPASTLSTEIDPTYEELLPPPALPPETFTHFVDSPVIPPPLPPPVQEEKPIVQPPPVQLEKPMSVENPTNEKPDLLDEEENPFLGDDEAEIGWEEMNAFVDSLEKDEIDELMEAVKLKTGNFDEEKTRYLESLRSEKLQDEKINKCILYWVEEVLSLASGPASLSDNTHDVLDSLLEKGKTLDFHQRFAVILAGYRLAVIHAEDETDANVEAFEQQLFDLIDENFSEFKKLNLQEYLDNPSLQFDKFKASQNGEFVSAATKLYNRKVVDDRIALIAKVAGLGGILAAGFGIFVAGPTIARGLNSAFDYMSDFWGGTSAEPPPPSPTHFDMPATMLDDIGLIREDLQGLRMQSLGELGVERLFTDTMIELNTIEKSLNQAPLSEMEALSQRVENARQEVENLVAAAAAKKASEPSLDTPLTALYQTEPKVALSDSLLTALLRQSIGGDIQDQPVDPNLSIDYMRERLPFIGASPKERKIAEDVKTGLSVYQACLNNKIPQMGHSFENSINQAQKSLQKTILEIKDNEDKFGPETDSKAKKAAAIEDSGKIIQDAWKTETGRFKEFLSEQIDQRASFFLPSGTRGEILHFIPEASPPPPPQPNQSSLPPKWTVRLYSPNAAKEGYRPYIEANGLDAAEFLNAGFVNDLLIPHLAIPPVSEELSPFLPKAITHHPLQSFWERVPSPPLSNAFYFPILSGTTFQGMLNNILFVELGPEAFLDYQISSIKHFTDDHEASGFKPQTYTLLKHAVSSLAYASERAGTLGWISQDALTEKTRILREIGKSLRKAQFKARKNRKAPTPSDSIKNKAAGEIPPLSRPLQKEEANIQDHSKDYVQPLKVMPDTKLVQVPPGKLLSASEVNGLLARFDSEPHLAFQGFRSWTSKILEDPTALNGLPPQESMEMIHSLSQITSQIQKTNEEDNRDIAAALVEAAVVADTLMGNLPEFKDARLPIPQMIHELKKNGALDPRLNAIAENLSDHKTFFFEEAIRDYYHIRDDTYGESWQIIRLKRTNAPRPPHVTFLLQNYPERFKRDLTKTYYTETNFVTPSNPTFMHLKKIVENNARFSAKLLTESLVNFANELDIHAVEQPLEVIKAVRLWSAANPLKINRGTLEMMSEPQRVEILEALGKISQTFLAANFRASKMLPDPETLVTNLQFLTFADQVMSYSPNEKLNLNGLPLGSFIEFFNENLFFRTFDPKSDLILQDIKDWLLERKQDFRTWRQPLFGKFDGFFNPNPQFMWETEILNSIKLPGTLTDNVPFLSLSFNQLASEFAQGIEAYVNPDYVFPNGKTVPPWYYSLRDLCYATYHTMRSGFFNPAGDKAPANSFQPVYSVHSNGFFSFTTDKRYIDHRLTGVGIEDLARYPEIPDGTTRGHLFAHLEAPIEEPGVIKAIRDTLLHPRSRTTVTHYHSSEYQDDWTVQTTYDYKPGISPPVRDIFDLNTAMVQNAEADRSYSSDDFRVKWSMRGEQGLQSFLAISTYMENPEWLTHPTEQIEFLNLLFDPGLLYHHLQEPNGIGPKAEADLAKFFYNQFKIHHDKKELQVFFVEAAVRLHHYSEAARKASPKIYEGIPVPIELEALFQLPKKILAKSDISENERSAYGALQALTFLTHQQLTPAATIEFLNGVLFHRAYAPLNMVNDLNIDRQLNRMFEHFEPTIIQTLYPEGTLREERLHQILKGVVRTEGKVFKASETNPLIFQDAEGEVEINLQEGTVIEKGREGASLPGEARLSQAYASLYGNAAHRAKSLNRNTFQFTDEKGFKNVIQKGSDRKWHLYREFPDSPELYKFISTDWTAWDAASKSQKPIKWLQSDWMLSQYSHWYREGTNPEIRLLDRTGALAFRVDLGGENGRTVKGIYKTDHEGKEYLLADIEQAGLEWLRQFEDPGFVHVWLSPETHKEDHAELPRFGIRLTNRGGKWRLDNAPQYFVAPRQIHPLFPEQTNFLLLKSAKGEQRLLFPRQTPVRSEDLALTANIKFDTKQGLPLSQKILSADKNPKTGQFEGADVESNLYLSMLHLAQSDYGRARELLLRIADHESRFTKEETEILDWMIDASNLPPNDTPQFIAIRTLAAQIKSHNIEKNRISSEDKYDVPKEIINQYLQVREGLSGLRLPVTEECQLFKHHILIGDVPIDEALAVMQANDPIAAREALDKALPQLLLSGKFARNEVLRLGEMKTSSGPVYGSIAPARGPVISSEELIEFLEVEPSQATPQREGLPPSMTQIFDYKAEWFLKLPAPTQEFFRNYEMGVQKYLESRDQNHYRLTNPEKLSQKRAALEINLKERTLEMERLRLSILDLANPVPKDKHKAKQYALQLESGTIQPVSFDQLINAFGVNNLHFYQTLNPEIDLLQAEKIDQALQTFIDLVPEWEHEKQLIEALQAVEKTQGDNAQAQIRNLVSLVQGRRQLPSDVQRLMKVMEYQTGTYYRGAQVESLGRLGIPGLGSTPQGEEKSAVHRITVGAGKTSRLLPTLSRYYAEEGKLALAIMPEAQLASAGKEFSYTMKTVYGVSTVELEFTRSTNSVQHAATLKKLNKAILKGRPVLTSGKSLRVLRNLYVESYINYISKSANGSATKEDLQAVSNLQKIVNLLAVKPIIDEIHKEYDTRIETNHPIGDPKPLPEEYGVITLNLYEILSHHPEIQSRMHFNFLPQKKSETAKPFSEQRFAKEIAPLLAQNFLERLNPGNPDLDQELLPLAVFYQGLSPAQQTEITQYLLKQNAPSVTKWIEGLDKPMRDQLGLIRGELTVLMPLTLNRNFGERYGYVNADDIVPTPFSAAGSPNKGSQHSSPFERLNYLHQGLAREGPRPPMIKRIVRELKQNRLKELNEKLNTSDFELGERTVTKADVDFQKLFPDMQLTLDTPDLEEKIMAAVKDDPRKFRHLTKTYAISQVKVYPKNLKATSQHLGNLFEEWQGFSGTPNNFPTYPGKFQEPKDDIVVGRMLTLISEHAFGKTHTVKIAPQQILKSEKVKNADAFMDAGGIFATENIESLADEWGDQVGKANVRIDPKEGIVIKQKGQLKAVPLRATVVPSDERVSLYDQPNIVGTDIPQRRGGIGIVSVSKSMTFTELEQAAGRMREIEAGQTIELLILDDDAIVMKETMGFPPEHELSSQDVIIYLLINESKEIMSMSETALRLKLHAVLDNTLFNWMKTTDPAEVSQREGVLEMLETVFEPDVSISPFDLFGKEEIETSREEVFAAEIEQLIGPTSLYTPVLEKVFKEDAPAMIASMKKEMEGVVADNIKYVNERLKKKPASDLEKEQELLQEQKILIEQEMNTELLQEQVQQPKTTEKPLRHKAWRQLDAKTIANWEYWTSTKKESDQASLFSLSDLIKQDRVSNELSDLFDPRITLSNNFQPNPLFVSPQKPAQFVMIQKNSNTGEIRLSLVEPWEVAQFKKTLYERDGIKVPNLFESLRGYDTNQGYGITKTLEAFDLEDLYPNYEFFTSRYGAPDPVSDTRLWIGHVSGRKAAGDDAVFDITDPEIKKMWIQTQVFSGRLNFSAEQQEVVKEWLDQWAADKVRQSGHSKEEWLRHAEGLIKKLIASREDVIAEFPRTDLGRILKELRKNS